MKRVNSELVCRDKVAEGTVKCPVHGDILLPTGGQEAASAGNAEALVFVGRREAAAGRAVITCTLSCLVTVTGESGEVFPAGADVPFSLSLECPDILPEDNVVVTVRPEELSVRVISSRKLSVSGLVSADILVLRRAEKLICADIGETEFPVHCLVKSGVFRVLASAEEKRFQLTDRFELPRERAGARDILALGASVSAVESKCVGSKLVLKGSFAVRCRYLSYEGTAEEASFELPFSEILPFEGDESCAAELRFCLGSLSLTPDADSFYEGRSLILEADITAFSLCEGTREVRWLADAYSTERRVLPVYEQIKLGDEAVRFISDFRTEEFEGPQDALTLRRTVPGEALWDIARDCRSTVEAIRQANGIKGDITEKAGMLIVPTV